MTARLRALSLAVPLLAASTAAAQAPGDYTQPPPPPVAYPPPAMPVPARDPVMAHRLSVGVSVGSQTLAPQDGAETRFVIGELAVRLRATRHLELELAMSGGREDVEEMDDALAIGSITGALRVRLNPADSWNWYVMVGAGGAVVERRESTQLQRDNATRALGMIGLGVEKRFSQFALQGELRAIGMGPRADSVQVAAEDAPLPRAPSDATRDAEELAGAMFTLGASYYF